MVYLACHNNNQAETVLTEFLAAVDNFGLPSLVLTDQGVENVVIARFMLTHPERGEGRGSHIIGKSVHNQRVERLWRDVYYACTLSTLLCSGSWKTMEILMWKTRSNQFFVF